MLSLLWEFVAFFKNLWGTINKPYQTYRRLEKENLFQLVILFFLIGLYFFFVSPIKLHTLHPLLLTLNATRLFSVTITTYLGICLFLFVLGKMIRGDVRLHSVSLLWGFSLLPTLLWFLITSFFYVILPPPRHQTVPGILFSLLFISLSLALFLWKGVLYYLTLRFGLKLELKRIIIISAIFLPTLVLYAVIMYKLSIFRVPFV